MQCLHWLWLTRHWQLSSPSPVSTTGLWGQQSPSRRNPRGTNRPTFNPITSMDPRSVNEPQQPAGVDVGVLYLGRKQCKSSLTVVDANVPGHIAVWNQKAMQEAASLCFLLLLSHIFLCNMPVLGGTDTALCSLAPTPSHIHLNAERGEWVGAPEQCCSPRKVLLQESCL